jgi:hypothetical protein
LIKTFTCFLHKRGVATPELRVLACSGEKELPGAVLSALTTWGAVETVDVFDADDRPIVRLDLSATGQPTALVGVA